MGRHPALALAIAGALCATMLVRSTEETARAFVFAGNGLALVAFAYDKLAARERAPRVPEAALHLLGLVGVAGACLGRALFRHKTLHPSFTLSQFMACIGTFLAAVALA